MLNKNVSDPARLIEHACLYRYRVTDNSILIDEDAMIDIDPRFTPKRADAYFNGSKRVFVSITEGDPYIDNGLIRFWLQERNDKRATDIIRKGALDHYNEKINELKNKILKYEEIISKTRNIKMP